MTKQKKKQPKASSAGKFKNKNMSNTDNCTNRTVYCTEAHHQFSVTQQEQTSSADVKIHKQSVFGAET